jgi:hypothetical protein
MKDYGGQCKAHWAKAGNSERAYYSDKGMLEAMVVWAMTMKGREEMNGSVRRCYSQDIKAQQMGEGNAATKEAKGRTSGGGPGHHLRDGTTARAKEQGRQAEERDYEA